MTNCLGLGVVVTNERTNVADVAIKVKDRPMYISDADGMFEFALTDGTCIIEKIEKPGYTLISPQLPHEVKNSNELLRIVMENHEDDQQRDIREKGQWLYNEAQRQEQERLYGDAADTLIMRADLDPMNVRWQIETGKYMHKYGDYKTAQGFYNRAIKAAEELYGEKNQLLARCYELYGDNYFVWRVWGEDNVLNYADAKNYYQRGGHFWYTLYGEGNNHVARIYYKMAACWYKLENKTNAKTCIDKAIETLRITPEPDPKWQSRIFELKKELDSSAE